MKASGFICFILPGDELLIKFLIDGSNWNTECPVRYSSLG